MLSMGFSAVELLDENVSEVVKSPPQYIYASTESAINKTFLDMGSGTAVLRSIALIVVNESHCGNMPVLMLLNICFAMIYGHLG